MTINVAETIRKMMSWCPNAGALTRRKSVQFDNLTVNAPGSGCELTHTTAGWWNKQRNRILIVEFIVTYLSIYWFILYGINNMNVFLAGLFMGILYGVLTWAQGLHSLDRIGGSATPIKTSTKHMLAVYILMILSIIIIGYLVSIYGWGATLAFISGFGFPSWVSYLQFLYWEKKNRKTIVVHGFYKPTVVAINSDE